MKTERELFEDFCFKSGLVTNKDFFKNKGWCDVVSGAWMAWQASASREGFVLVPKEPTQLMYRDFCNSKDASNAPNSAGKFKEAYKAMIEVAK